MHPSSETLGQSEGVRERQNNEKKLSLRPLTAPESLRMDEYKMVDESLEKKAILVLKITKLPNPRIVLQTSINYGSRNITRKV